MDSINQAQNHRANSLENLLEHFNSAGLNMVQINLRGINRFEKLDSLCIFLQGLPIVVDVLVIGETWIKASRQKYYNIPGFSSIHSCRTTSSGGLAVFIRNGLNFEVKANTADDGLHHIETAILPGKSRVTVHGIYRPPSFDSNRFFSFVESIISLSDPRNPCFILGDINFPINSIDSRGAQTYLQLLASYNMLVTNTHVTRPTSSNILDHVVCHAETSERITNCTMDCNLSDHCYIVTHFNTKIEKCTRTLYKSVVNHRLLETHFLSFLETTDFSSMQPNDRLLAITSRYKQLKDSFSKTITVEVKVKKNVCPWYNLDIWKLGRISNNLFQRWKRNRQDQHVKDLLKHANNKLAEAKRRAKSRYYQRFFSTSNPKVFWTRVNDALGNKTGEHKQHKLIVDGLLVTEPGEVGDVFNSFFTSVGENVASCLQSDGNINRFNTVELSDRSIFFRPATQSEVINIIGTLDSSKATGVDSFPVSALKQYSAVLSGIICNCFNDSLSSGAYPDFLKKALVYPVFKSGDPTNPTNYRPISVLPTINKVFEKLLSTRLHCFLETTGLLYERQFGFRQGSTTDVAILELVDDIARSVDRRKVAGAVFLDLSKAFDTINHSILLKKLDAYGIRGIANDLINSYLTGRYQKVMVDGICSEYRSVSCGVPQGSNIGPLLFLLYINDIAKLPLEGQPRLFADDTALTYETNSVAELYQHMCNDLHLVTAYLENNLLALNLSKTKLMVFGAKEDETSLFPTLTIKGEILERVSYYKYLGVHIDDQLRWDVHIRKTVANCASLCGILRKLARYVPQHVLLKVYFAYIHSRYQYGISAWGSSYNTYLKDIQIQQNRCIKAIFKLPFLHPTNDLYSTTEHNILPIQGLYTLRVCMIMYKTTNSLNMHHNWSFNSASHHYRTRYAHLLQRPGFRSEVGRKRFQNIGPDTFNRLPEDIKNAQSIAQFKRRFIAHIKSNIETFIVR
uniref:Putative tick transposon n=1 Tax=Aedes albopictus TaxID=7160 RepID=A0A1W7R639_AEDAL